VRKKAEIKFQQAYFHKNYFKLPTMGQNYSKRRFPYSKRNSVYSKRSFAYS
jgi:hypothetical protein